jgi:SNF2 family DNA or RNA helicase
MGVQFLLGSCKNEYFLIQGEQTQKGTLKNIKMEENNIIINESFLDDGLKFDNLERNEFSSPELFELKKQADNLVKDDKISELLSYNLIEKNLAYKLPYQKQGALKLLNELNATALLADEVGLGKTITAGLVLKEGIYRGIIKTALILTPPSLVEQWVEELRDKFELDFKILEDVNDWSSKYPFIIASIDRVKSYDCENKRFRHFKAQEVSWDLVLVDEAHKLKEKNTVRWQFVNRLQKKRFLLLTATPFQNDLFELYNLLHLLKKGHLGTIKEFRDKFLYRGNKRYPLNAIQLKEKLSELMVRRRRDETGIEYKRRIPKIVKIKLTLQEKTIYDNITELIKKRYFMANGNQINGLLAIYAILPKITSSSRSAIETLERISGDPKYHDETRNLAKGILEDYKSLEKDSKIEKLLEVISEIRSKSEDEKILIYTRHPTTLRYIIEKLAPQKLNIIEFLGGLDREEKSKRINAFKQGLADIMISTDTGAEGLNFQFCRNLVNYDLPWNPMSVEQRIGRLDRIGQKRDMYIYSFATVDTMEEYVVDLIINKMCCVGLVIGELPIILFNLGLDGEGKNGGSKIEERLITAFLNSKGNLKEFSKSIREISTILERGIDEYSESKKATSKLLD